MHVKNVGTPDTYIFEFQGLEVMVIDISEARLTLLFTEGLEEPLKGLVKAY